MLFQILEMKPLERWVKMYKQAEGTIKNENNSTHHWLTLFVTAQLTFSMTTMFRHFD